MDQNNNAFVEKPNKALTVVIDFLKKINSEDAVKLAVLLTFVFGFICLVNILFRTNNPTNIQ